MDYSETKYCVHKVCKEPFGVASVVCHQQRQYKSPNSGAARVGGWACLNLFTLEIHELMI